jgi:hypothetical protein
MYFHLGQRFVIHLVLEANQTKEKPIWGSPSITKAIEKYSQTTKKMEILKMQMTKSITT